jgi:hypothetical protein
MNNTLNIPFNKAGKKNLQLSSDPQPPSYVKVFVTKYKARKEAKKTIKGLKEVKDFESGKKTPKSFDDFLKTL